jgi:hypothetical protein
MSKPVVQSAPSPGNLPAEPAIWSKPSAWVELALTLPIFLLYHAGVVFLGFQNATDFTTRILMLAAEGSTARYLGITGLFGVFMAAAFALAGRGTRFGFGKFVQVACEGVIYAILGRLIAGYVVGRLFAGPIPEEGRFAGFVMSLGAGFYEELAFRVLLFGLGVKALVWFWSGKKLTLIGAGSFSGATLSRSLGVVLIWALVCGVLFSGMHYVGELSDAFALKSFLFRLILGLFFTGIYITRGFAAAVWTHALYDIWVLVLH